MSFAPIRHFTDHEIRVHLFTCVLALAIAHLMMRREAARAGPALSVPALLGELDGIGILGYVATAAKHGLDKITALRDALTGRPWMPALPAPA